MQNIIRIQYTVDEVHARNGSNGIGRRVLVAALQVRTKLQPLCGTCAVHLGCSRYLKTHSYKRRRKNTPENKEARQFGMDTHSRKRKMTGGGRCWWRRQPSISCRGKRYENRGGAHVSAKVLLRTTGQFGFYSVQCSAGQRSTVQHHPCWSEKGWVGRHSALDPVGPEMLDACKSLPAYRHMQLRI